MTTFHCGTCGVNPADWKDKPFELWPCATCSLSKNYYHTFSTGYFDTLSDEVEDEKFTLDPPEDHPFVIEGSFPLRDNEIDSLETIRAAIEKQVCSMFSGIIVKLLEMAKKNPVMFEVLIKKLQFPYMSYSEIGDTLSPKCSKQNVLHHLKTAVAQFPELGLVIHTDTRYSGGHYALRTLADIKRREQAENAIQRNIYGKHYAQFRHLDMKELNRLLRLPFMVRDEVFSFNAYVKDEEHVADGAAGDKD